MPIVVFLILHGMVFNSKKGYNCPGLNYGVLRFKSVAWDARIAMNIPVTI